MTSLGRELERDRDIQLGFSIKSHVPKPSKSNVNVRAKASFKLTEREKPWAQCVILHPKASYSWGFGAGGSARTKNHVGHKRPTDFLPFNQLFAN